MANPHYARLMASNLKLLQTGKYSDMVVKCGTREWHVHRSIVCEASNFFTIACDGPFLESSSKEIVLEDDDPTIFERLLSYLYTLDYDDDSPLVQDRESPSAKSDSVAVYSDQGDAVLVPALADTRLENPGDSTVVAVGQPKAAGPSTVGYATENPGSSLMINVQVYAMADKFDIAELKVLAMEKFSKCAQGWPLPNFTSVVHEALSSTPESDRGLRGILKKILAEHIDDIYPLDDPTLDEWSSAFIQETRKQWCNALRDEGHFLYELLGTVTANKAREQERLRMTNVDVVADLQDSQQDILRLKAEIKHLKARAARLELEMGEVRSRGAKLLEGIDSRDECRHCHLPFQPTFDDIDDWHRNGSLRCKKCRTKHGF